MSIRLRLTLWLTALLAAVLTGLAILVYLVVSDQMANRLDTNLRERAADMAAELPHEDGGPRRRDKPCVADQTTITPLQVMGDLIAHHPGLFEHLRGEGVALMRIGFFDDDRQRRLDRMCQVSDVGSRAFDDLAVGIDQRVGLAGERRDLDRKFALEPLGAAGADVGDGV